VTLDDALAQTAALIDAELAVRMAEAQAMLVQHGATFEECEAARQWQLAAAAESRQRALALVRAVWETGAAPQ
jgi:hypothetical protein